MTKYVLLASFFLSLVFYACKKSTDNGNGGINPPPPASTTFIGKGGIYYLGNADVPLSTTAYTNPNLAGAVVRLKWENLETAPGVFNWSYIDGELTKAKASNKKISVQVLGYPSWVITTLGAGSYNYIDKNVNHSTYLDTLKDVITWDNIYLNRISNLVNNLSVRYSNDTSVAYFNLVSGQISRGFPDTVITATGPKAFWTTFPYNADTVVAKMKPLLDLYMTKFPKTPLWSSVDYVSFESKASGRANNYLTSQYVAYGVTTYPDRFGCWREDIAACNPQPNVQNTSQWFVMGQNPTRTGAQMLWNVQDGPNRMNKCGILPNTKQVVLDSSINNGLRLGMRYFEVYAADINDATLSINIANYNNTLKAKYSF
ncbi:MAG: hypothetical protein HZB42_10430 [Sphingobacteriales bacterium]|nr:hypothetical protein [Sphingobacteriales bacterium]